MITTYVVRITLIALGALLACAPLSRAAEPRKQGGQGQAAGQQRRGGAEAQIQRMAEELNLTADQKAKLKTIFEKQYKEMQAMRDNSDLSQEDRRAKYRELREKYDPQIKAVLTPEQAAKWEKLEQKAREQRKKRSE